MKKLFTFFASLSTISAGAQQCQAPSFANTLPVQEQLINYTIPNNTLIIGNGQVGGGVSYINPTLIKFKYVKTTDNDYYPYLHAVSPLNLPYGAKLYTDGIVYINTLTMSGNDTVFCADNSETHILGVNPNNGGNVIMLGHNSTLTIDYQYTNYHVGDTIKTSNNPANFIYVLQCTPSIPLNMGIQEFYEYSGTLHWVLSDNSKPVTVEYSDGIGKWLPVTETRELSLKVEVSGLYRIRQGNEYSKVVKVQIKQRQGRDGVRWYFNGHVLEILKN